MIRKNIILNAQKTDNFLKRYLNKEIKSFLIKPMKYGTLNGGKKIRSSIIINTGKLFNIKLDKLINVCGAVESIHSYSLIHDDLPCMDNDKIRRGKASTHIKYGESTAVLAGNSLLTLAFEMIAEKNYKVDDKIKIELIKELASCSGHSGIAGGQELDLRFEKKKKSLEQIIRMQRKKTGKLFNFCCLSAGIIAKKNRKIKNELSNLGEDIGLLFQLADDFIDIDGSLKLAGKPIKKDKKKGKSTLISLIGYEKAYKYANNLKKNILLKLKKHGKNAKDLSSTIEFILGRNF
ncbi:MAG: polyprenyl synthetase family protein [Pelagibacteraceae bacterium]